MVNDRPDNIVALHISEWVGLTCKKKDSQAVWFGVQQPSSLTFLNVSIRNPQPAALHN